MKLLGRWHLFKVKQVPMHAIISEYFWKNNRINDKLLQSQIKMKAFEDGYRQALIDGGIQFKDHPKGTRE